MFEPPAYARSRPNLHRQVAAAASRAAGISWCRSVAVAESDTDDGW